MKRLAFTLSVAALTGVCVISRWCSEQETTIRRLRADLDTHTRHSRPLTEADAQAMADELERDDSFIHTLSHTDGTLRVRPWNEPGISRRERGERYLAERRA